jgi:cysteine desulfurase/selenocysteine lyase
MTVFLDNSATTFPKPESVYRAVEHAFREIGVGPGRGGYGRGLAATRLVFEARETLADFFGLEDSSRLIFTHSATEALNLAVTGLLREGDHVVSTTMEHNSLVRPLHLASQRGVEITWVEGDAQGSLDPRRIAEALRPSTRLVALAHCSNVTGTVQPVGEIGALAKSVGALLLVDAAQSAGVIPIDVAALQIDLLAVPGHKGLFGPPGSGFLSIAEGVELMPFFVGGTGGYSSSIEQPETLPERFESGTMNTPAIAGLQAGVTFVRETGIDTIRKHEAALIAKLHEGLGEIPGAVLFGPTDPAMHCGPVSFTLAGCDPAQIAFLLDRDYEISVRAGLHCAPLAHRTIGTYPAGTVRVSPGYFNTSGDIESFLLALRTVATAVGPY